MGNAVAKAVPKECAVHLDFLRAYPAEDDSILIHRNGARTDSQLLEPSFLAQLLSHENQELLNRPAKGVSMLVGSMVFGGPGTGANGIGARPVEVRGT